MESNPSKLSSAPSLSAASPLAPASEVTVTPDQPPRAPPQRDAVGADGEETPAESLATRTTTTTTTAEPLRPPTPQNVLRPFGEVPLRPAGQRYGDADLRPAGLGSAGLGIGSGGGGMLMGDEYFRGAHGVGGGASGSNPADLFARHDPIMPGQARPMGFGGVGRVQPQRAPLFPGEPDPDQLMPLQGGPRDPFGGPGGGQFGPARGGFGAGGGFGSW